MAETVKKASSTKAPAKARKTAAPKAAAPKAADTTTAQNATTSNATAAGSAPVAAGTASPKSAPSTKTGTGASKVTPFRYSHDQVAQLAHKYWAERGRRDGHHLEDWFRAEQELRSKAS
jgi:hypothetical protein